MNQSAHSEFVELHRGTAPLMLANIWDAGSASFFQAAGARALGTSSAAMAWSLGYPDGSSLPRKELLGAVERIMRLARVPLTVDIEDGYSRAPGEVAKLAMALAERGVVGINIEDGADTPALLSHKIGAIRRELVDQPLFINARTDIYLRGLTSGEAAVALAIERLSAYRAAGADGGFLPGLSAVGEAARVADKIPMPLNLMALPHMASVPELYAAGVRRLSGGPSPFLCAFSAATEIARRFHQGDIGDALFGHGYSHDETNRAFVATVAGT